MNGAAAYVLSKAYTDNHGGGGGGTSNYNQLSNKPKINGVELSGNKTLKQLGITDALITSAVSIGDGNQYTYNINDYDNFRKALQTAINDTNTNGGGDIIVAPGEYELDKCIYMKSHVHIYAYGVEFVLADQISRELTNPTTNGYSYIFSDDDFEAVNPEIGDEFAFTDGTTGYVTDFSKARVTFITDVIPEEKKVIFEDSMIAGFDHIVTQPSMFRADTNLAIWQGDNTDDIMICGGRYCGNFYGENYVKVADMHNNGLVFGGVRGLIIKDVEVFGCGFQGIHYTGGDAEDYDWNAYIQNCHVYDCKAAGICIDTNQKVTVIDCRAHENSIGLQMVWSSYCNVIGGIYSDNDYNNIRIVGREESHIDGDYNTIFGARITGTGNNKVGIGIKDGNFNIISNCVIELSGSNGKAVDIEYANNTTINGCNFDISDGILVTDDTYSTNTRIGCCTKGNYTLNGTGSINLDNSDTTELNKVVLEESGRLSADGGDIIETSNGFIYVHDFSDIAITGKNLFDVDSYLSSATDYQGYIGMELTVKPNTKYTCSTELKSGNTVYFGTGLDIGVDENGGTLTATSDNNGHIYIWILNGRANYNNYVNGILQIQIEEGETASKFEPYYGTVEAKNGLMYIGSKASIEGDTITYRKVPLSDLGAYLTIN